MLVYVHSLTNNANNDVLYLANVFNIRNNAIHYCTYIDMAIIDIIKQKGTTIFKWLRNARLRKTPLWATQFQKMGKK